MSRPETRTSLDEDVPIDPLASYADLGEIARTHAYAQLRAIMLAWAHVPVRDPTELVRGAIDQVVSSHDVSATDVGQRLRDTIRAETASAFREAIAKACLVSWRRSLAPRQLDDADLIELAFHDAGELAGRVRGEDPRILSAAVGLTDYLRARQRARLANGVTAP
jgi:hypothetical protein